MAIDASDFHFLDDVLYSLAKKASDVTKIPLPASLASNPLFGPPQENQDAKTYLADLAQQFHAAEAQAIAIAKDAVEGSPPYELGHEIGNNLIAGAKRASKIAREVGSDLADTFDKTADRLTEGGLTIAKTFGAGLALAVIFALIWLGRKA